MIILRLHQEGITRDRNHPEGAEESTIQMKSNFFVLNSGANLERHTHTGFRFMSVFRKYPTSTANFIYIGVVRGTYFTANQIFACKNTVKNF